MSADHPLRMSPERERSIETILDAEAKALAVNGIVLDVHAIGKELLAELRALRTQLEMAQADAKRLGKALRMYGEHRWACNERSCGKIGHGCNCGFEAACASSPASTPQPTQENES